MTFRVIDTETCGLDAGVVEIASLDLSDTGISNVMSDLVNPGRPIGLDAMAIHHITEEMVADKPRIARVIAKRHYFDNSQLYFFAAYHGISCNRF